MEKSMYLTSKVRMNRLFKQGRCLDVAIDHGVCNELHF
ncbi:DhnA-type fructose-1,6-bisphosphate aldolase and related enzymes [Vibrio maritimus]|uniref:DhnA-type fructose-1,6-bisphosphate aldolase and related enzymes n=1 Tax=Vibrio maritimus TaxID=990268 RepID=A0A090T4H3_9VIBR|nr:DhnA-type fructose-1,6-bisphosphate aldolase and related enzymes [Vibrio maritimus]